MMKTFKVKLFVHNRGVDEDGNAYGISGDGYWIEGYVTYANEDEVVSWINGVDAFGLVDVVEFKIEEIN